MSDQKTNPKLKKLVAALEDLTKQIETGYNDDRALSEIWGWNVPTISRTDLGSYSGEIAKELKEKGEGKLDDEMLQTIDLWISRIPKLKDTAQYFFNGHAHQAVPAYLISIEELRRDMEPLLGWQRILDPNTIPAKLARRIRAYTAELDQIAPDKEELEKRIALITEATSAAETLPTDIEALTASRRKIEEMERKSSVAQEKVEGHLKEAIKAEADIKDLEAQARKLVEQCEQAYRITTTKGLAAAFDQRANKLSASLWIWVAGLVFALVGGYYVGATRLNAIAALLNSPNTASIWLNVIMAFFSLGAPIWLAWIATKQIAQRFRLAEDYAFKASVAKAYEGYRKEAARIDKSFEARLFGSALARLEEAPLRLVEEGTPGSPWHEFIDSDAFKEALKVIPGLQQKYRKAVNHKSTGDIGAKSDRASQNDDQ